MADIIIVVSPAFKGGKRQHDRFDAHLADTGEVVFVATRQPMLDAARVLLDRGRDPHDVICKVCQHAPEIVSMRAPIGVAAWYDIMGAKFVRRKVTNSTSVSTNRARPNASRAPPTNIQSKTADASS
jgi:hypothetical protein